MSSESMREVGGLQSILLYMLSILVFFIPNSQQNTKKNLWDLLMVQTVKIFSKSWEVTCVMSDTTQVFSKGFPLGSYNKLKKGLRNHCVPLYSVMYD